MSDSRNLVIGFDGTWNEPQQTSEGEPAPTNVVKFMRAMKKPGNWGDRHDGRNCVLIDELGMPVAAQQYAEIVEPGDNALELDAVDQEYRYWRLVFANIVKEYVLEVLAFIS